MFGVWGGDGDEVLKELHLGRKEVQGGVMEGGMGLER